MYANPKTTPIGFLCGPILPTIKDITSGLEVVYATINRRISAGAFMVE